MNSEIPTDPTPDSKKGIPFSVEADEFAFTPFYYPERFNQTRDNELKREGAQCAGEEVYVKKKKNTEYHATGIVLADNIDSLKNIIDTTESVDLITPIGTNGGVEVSLKKGKIGEIVGWDKFEEQWQFSYTLDFVATGRDNGGDKYSPIVDGFVGYRKSEGELLRELQE
jgi:hypothetical protein